MPRYVDRVAKPLTTAKRLERDKRFYVRNSNSFVDPFPNIHGTLPEKMVYASLSRYGIPFLFLNDIRFTMPEIEFDKSYQADFIIPSVKLIIEVQGSYWHSMEKTIEADAFKFAVYEMGGYKTLAWWDYDIYDHLDLLITSEPLLMSLASNPVSYQSRELPVVKRTKVDSSKGIRTLNAKRAARLSYKKIIKYKGQSKGIKIEGITS